MNVGYNTLWSLSDELPLPSKDLSNLSRTLIYHYTAYVLTTINYN